MGIGRITFPTFVIILKFQNKICSNHLPTYLFPSSQNNFTSRLKTPHKLYTRLATTNESNPHLLKASNIRIDVQSSDAGPPRLVIVAEADGPSDAVYFVTWNWPLLNNTVVGAASRVGRNDVGTVL